MHHTADHQAPTAIIEGVHDGSDVEARDRRFRRALAAADLVATALALLLTIALLGDNGLRAGSLLVFPLVVGLAKLHGLYDRDELLIRKTTMDEAPQIFQLATLCTLVFWLAHGSIIDGDLYGSQVVVLWAGMFSFGLVGRWAARTLARRATAAERCLFIGDARSYDRLRAKLESPSVKVDLVGRMNLQRTGRKGERATHIAELRELIRWTRAHRLIIEPQVLPPEEMLDFVRAAKSVGVRVSLLPRVLDVVGSSIVFDQLDGLTLLGVRRFGLSRSSALVKRTFDLVGGSLIMLAAGPAMALIALLVKLDTRGPVLFRQTRIGRDGKPFRICKFRTMVVDAEAQKAQLRGANEVTGGLFKIADDPRITRVGRILRKTSLDELPQLLNVMTGDMSLVGPRPLVTDEDAQIKGWDRRRLHLTPGMTGHWQIAGSARVPMHEMVKIDYLYVAGWSLWSDLKLLARTIPYVIARRGM